MNAMRSKEIAELAGVSVRTLRHYHQIGILPEPHRGSNNYRHYTLANVGTLLRIRRLVALGVTLDQVPAFLDDEVERSDVLLDELDRGLAARIAELRDQRAVIAQLRAQQHRPDLPRGLDTLAALVGAAGSNLADLERDAFLVVAGLTGDTHESDLLSLSAALQRADRAGALSSVAHRYKDLEPDTSAAEVVSVVDELLTLLGNHLVDFLTSSSGQKIRRAAARKVLEIHSDPRLSTAQAAVLRVFGDRLQALIDDDPDAGRATEPGR
ncbi:MerR family transcriptional regulator [Nakamurella sp. A5-74]|uniref:MerR family transcriptional regulator n=1 Tax=Nakamurella sp. A5-74 TaxID=3158264 RepID=A0AAU8DTQ4_9ACTN